MRRAIMVWAAALSVCALVAGPGCGQTAAPAAPAATDGENKATAATEGRPKPDELLRQMSDYVCGLPSFSCVVELSIKIEGQGQKNESTTKVIARLQRPNKLALVMESGQSGMTIISDGKELVQYMPSLSRYVVSEAPADFAKWDDSGAMRLGSAGQLLPTEAEQFYKQLMTGVTGSEYLGTDKVGDVECHRLKFRQEDYNWELWIEVGERPLARKFVPDYSGRFSGGENMKIEYVVTFSDWDVAAKFTEADFKFEPPAGAEKVDSLLEGLEGGEEEGPHPLLGQAAPTFETVDLEDQAIDLKTHLGKDVVMLDFWATWCGPCVMAMPHVEGVAKKFADRGLVFYAVNVGEDVDTIKKFLESNELDVPVAMDQESEISGLYQANGIPQTVLIGKDGNVQVVHVGYSDGLAGELTNEVEDLLAGKDLATDVLAKAAEAKKKRAAAKKQVETAGVTPAWSVPGRWTGVAAPAAGDVVYAAGGDQVTVFDATGEMKQEIATHSGGTLRVANLIGDDTPEFVLFEAWRSGVKALSAAGELLWEYPPGDGVDDVWTADVNGDGMDEVIVGFNGGTGLHVLDNRGTPLWKFTDIGNVWHVTAGDFNQDGKTEVVSTSAQGNVHVFDAEGKKLKDIDVSIYGNMVRMAQFADGTTLAIVTGSGDAGETLVGVNYDGEEKFVLALPTTGVDHVDDMAVAASMPWAAVAMRGGLVNIVDLQSGQAVARVADQKMMPQVAWLPRKDQSPLLVVATGNGLNAFEITPSETGETVVEVADDADGASGSAEGSDGAAAPVK